MTPLSENSGILFILGFSFSFMGSYTRSVRSWCSGPGQHFRLEASYHLQPREGSHPCYTPGSPGPGTTRRYGDGNVACSFFMISFSMSLMVDMIFCSIAPRGFESPELVRMGEAVSFLKIKHATVSVACFWIKPGRLSSFFSLWLRLGFRL